MEIWERASIRFMLNGKLDELHGEGFEEFFHEVMCVRNPGFLSVRTAGSLGDQGADGLLLCSNKLYACYAPQTIVSSKIASKFQDDLDKAIQKRGGEFGTFVFVHNDRRGLHPEVASLLAAARNDHPQLVFENFGRPHFYTELCQMEKWQIEDFLGPFPAEPVSVGVVLEQLIPLLDHLAEYRRPFDDLPAIPQPPLTKMEYNAFPWDDRHRMKLALPYVNHVEDYYRGRLDPNERDEVAAGFRRHYEMIARTSDDSGTILWQLEQHILGNAKQRSPMELNALVVLMYFFGECEIFKVPPAGWVPATGMGVAT
ncbi:ABC-three component system protein [Sphaerisporangium sp. NPDC049003]|uniref:ABC-three component system protein n=1 Tax=Sphaerisporangium sp. NPDC049003 TaxID=3364517 RepID=UPI003724C00C